MTDIAGRRLWNQGVTRAGLRRPADVVRWMGAVQAQEYEPARWAIGLRLRDPPVDGEIERALQDGRILRTHVMRPTWHFVAPGDIRWLLALTAPRVHRLVTPYRRRLELDARVLVRSAALVERALRDRRHLTRAELGERLRRAGLAFDGIRLANVAMYAELEGLICSGPRRGKQSTYALFDERVPGAPALSRDEALATLSRRFFTSHAPATIRDFVWWSGLTTADARRGLDINRARPEDVDGMTYWAIGAPPRGVANGRSVHLLPIYDEYLVAYRDRLAVPHPPTVTAPDSRAVIFQHALVVGGQIAGTWRTARQVRDPRVDVFLRRRLTRSEQRGVAEAIGRYTRFVRGAST
jgi:winged helix DNA-binding protein